MEAYELFRTLILALALLAIPMSATASGWDWSLTPYGWAADVSLGAKVNDREIIDSEIDFKDLLDDTDFFLMLHFEGKREKAGLYPDLIVMDLGDEPRFFDTRGPTIEAKSDLEMMIFGRIVNWFSGSHLDASF